MEKAYDLKVLLDLLKAQGLEVAEESAKVLVSVLFDWVQMSAMKSENKYDDILAVLMPVIKPELMKAIDKINPADNA